MNEACAFLTSSIFSRGRYPPPTKWTISSLSPFCSFVSAQAARGRMERLSSMASRCAFSSSKVIKSVTLDSAGNWRGSPLMVISMVDGWFTPALSDSRHQPLKINCLRPPLGHVLATEAVILPPTLPAELAAGAQLEAVWVGRGGQRLAQLRILAD